MALALGGSSRGALEAAAALYGAGAAPVFAAGILWAERRYERPLGGRAAAAFSVSGSLGAELFPLALGQVVEAAPGAPLVTAAAAVAACAALMAAAAGVARSSLKKNETAA